MLRDGLLDARRKNLRVREARILTVLGELASARGDQPEAIERLRAAAEVARSAGLDRIEADASSALASRLREAGNIATAALYAKEGVAAARRARDIYHLPPMLATLAEIEAANGNFAGADATYSQATDLVHALLGAFLRQAALPPNLASDLDSWREVCPDTAPEALVFPSERGTYLSRDNFLRRNIQKKLEDIGLGWVNFQVLRRTQASLGHKEKIDPKVAADQRGHGIGVAIDTYTESDLESRREAVTKLETALLGRKPVERSANAESEGKPGFRGKRGKTG